MPSSRRVGISLAVGLVHAAALIFVATDLGYSIGPSEYSLFGMLWRYGGLVVVAALPVWMALRYRLVLPVIAVASTTGYVLGMELSPPGPTFTDVAELEHLDEPTGITVVVDGLYIVRYMVNASVWTVGFVFAGLVEYAGRALWDPLPAVRSPPSWLSIPAGRHRAVSLATGGGLLHAFVMVWFAHRLGVTVDGAVGWLLYGFGAVGMWVLAAVPLYLLFRHRLVLPAALLAVAIVFDVLAEFTVSVDDPHALYFWGWFFYLGVLLVVAGLECGFHRLEEHRGSPPS